MNKVSFRKHYLIGFLAIVVLLAVATFLQVYEGVIPCPLCITQRYVMCLLGGVFFFGIVFSSKRWGQLTAALVGLVVTVGGLLLSGRQVWLQHYPPDGFGDCSVSLDFMLKMLPLNEVIQKVWEGGTECSRYGWQFFQLSLAEWSFISFFVFFIFVLYLLKRAFSK